MGKRISLFMSLCLADIKPGGARSQQRHKNVLGIPFNGKFRETILNQEKTIFVKINVTDKAQTLPAAQRMLL
ncbi:MAG: hypothetical protein HC896_14755 [Bacteroidales bacterium]|nr:hypothetical protein [Bacteroidales bacterium]